MVRVTVDREWVTRSPDQGIVEELAASLDHSRTLARILANRELTDPERARRYLEAPLDVLHDPALLPEIERGVDRVSHALAEDEQIVVFADRDVDGIAGCALLVKALAERGGNVGWYVPGKYEGYGLNEGAVREIAGRGCDLLVTVDCGTTAEAEIDLAASRGMDVVVTDHHDTDSVPAAALACINPRRDSSEYPHEDLAGGGVAFKLGEALVDSLDSHGVGEYRADALPLVALATIGDYVELNLENRAIARAGYERLFDCDLPGLVRIAEHCDVSSIADLRWSLVPLLNASQEDPSGDFPLKLLFAESEERIAGLIAQLEDYRAQRRQQRRDRQAHLEECFEQQVDPAIDEELVYLVETDRYVGGSAMASLSEQVGRPVITYRQQEGYYKGGGRSAPDVDFIELYEASEDQLTDYWGHPGAAGFEVPEQAFDDFRTQLVDAVRDRYSAADLRPTLEIDLAVSPEDVTPELVEELQVLRPFGPGHDEPRLLVEGVEVVGSETFGRDDQHLRPVTADSEELGLVCWGGAEDQRAFDGGGKFDVVGDVDWNEYVGAPQVSVTDFRTSTEQ